MTTRLINEFIHNVVANKQTESQEAFKSVFGTENVKALLADIHNEKESEARAVLEPEEDDWRSGHEPTGERNWEPIRRTDAVTAAVGQANDVGSKLGIPADQLAKLITDPKFAEHLTRIKQLSRKTTPIRGITKADIR